MTMWLLYKKHHGIVRRLGVYRGEYAPLHPLFDTNAEAACKKRDGPLPLDVGNIVYTAADDAMHAEWVTNSLSQNWHGIGTCRMGPNKTEGVVDQYLSVYGVESLTISDSSILPVNMAADAANMAFTIGGKTTDIFAHELGSGK
jgi:alcohol oxidase